jgi:ferredoxin-NADP reductase
MKSSIKNQIEGYSEIQKEIEVLRKHAVDRSLEKGQLYETINQLHPSRITLRVSEIIQETSTTTTLRLVAPGGYLPPFQAGQFINIFMEVDGVRTSRPYSLSSPPNQIGYYDITIRRVGEGFVSDYLLDEVSVGTELISTSPTGNFFYNPLFHGDDLVYIAGGSGITPFMSMIREITDRGLDRKVNLIYGSRTSDDIVFQEELKVREERYSNLKINHVISEPKAGDDGLTGFINEDLIRSQVDSLDNKMFYICGPEALYSFVLKELEKLGIPNRRIRVEVFGPPAAIHQQPGWPEAVKPDDVFKVRFNGKDTIQAVAGEPLMNSLERSHLIIPASCRSGECSLCRTRLVSGKVYQPASVKMRKSDRKYHYIHPCMAYPLEDLELML